MVDEETKKAAKSPVSSKGASGVGIASLVTGIVAFLTGWIVVWGLIVGATAVVLGIIALKKSPANKAFGIVGIITGGIAVLTSLIFTVIWAIALTFVTVGSGAVIQAGHAVENALSAQQAEAQAQIDAKKDFSKGDTATFDKFKVKVNSVDTNYTPSNSYSTADQGSKYVLVNVTVTNPGDESVDVSSYDLQLSADGVANTSTYITVDDEFQGGDLAKGASASGNIAYQVKDNASELKLQYKTSVYSPKTNKLVNLTYSLDL